jgi:hypothetical protein
VKEKHSSNPLKRFGTVLGRRRQSAHPYGRASSPERKSSSNLGSAFSGFGKGKSKDREPVGSPMRPSSPLRRLSSTPRPSEPPESPNHARLPSVETTNGTAPEVPLETSGSSALNGSLHDTIPELKEPMSPPLIAETKPEVRCKQRFLSSESNLKQPEKDAEGFSVPSSAVDAITEAEREAGLQVAPFAHYIRLADQTAVPKPKTVRHRNLSLTSGMHRYRKRERTLTLLWRTWSTLSAR